MKKRWFSIVLILVGSILFITGNIIQYNLKVKEKNLVIDKNLILTDYDLFKIKYEKFSNVRREVYEEVINQHKKEEINIYYDDMIKKLNEYNQVYLETKSVSENLKKKVIDSELYYEDQELEKISEAFSFNYKQMINYFNSDIDTFNQEIKEYNKLIKNKRVKELPLYKPDTYIKSR